MTEINLILEIEPAVELELILAPEIGIIPLPANFVSIPGQDGATGAQGEVGAQGPSGTTPPIGGSNKQVQFNNSGDFAGASKVEINSNGSLELLVDATPITPIGDKIGLFAREIANRKFPAYSSPSGIDSALQPLLARNKVGYWCPPGNATTVPGVMGVTAPTITGFTATARNVATTNLFTRLRRLGYVTAATVGAVGQWRLGVAQFTVGNSITGLGGFTYIVRFGISDAVLASNARMFIGMRSVVTPINVEPNTLTQCIGVGHGANDTNLYLYYGGTVSQTPIDLGVNFPTNTTNTDIYELALFSPPNSGDVSVEVTRLNTGHKFEHTIINSAATILPTNTTLIGPWGFRTNNVTALAVGIDVASAYLETDF